MGCDEIRIQLAAYRELPPQTRDAMDRHIATCPLCMATMEQYQAQDRALGTLRSIEIAPTWAEGVRSRTVLRSRGAAPRLRPVRALAMVIVALVVISAGTLGASAQALPGSGLYPVKLAVEQVRLGLTADEARRLEYMAVLAEARREEVREVAEQGKSAEVVFEGRLEEVGESTWIVDGIAVEVDPATAQVGRSLVGSRVSVQAKVDGGQVAVSSVKIDAASVPTPSPAPTSTPARPTKAPTRIAESAPAVAYPSPQETQTREVDPRATRLAEVKQTAESALSTAAARATVQAASPKATPTPMPALAHSTPTRDKRTISRLETRLAARSLTLTALPPVSVGPRIRDELPQEGPTLDATPLDTARPTRFPQITGTLPAEWHTVVALPTGRPGATPNRDRPPSGVAPGRRPIAPPVLEPGRGSLPKPPVILPLFPKPPRDRYDNGSDAAEQVEGDAQDDQGEDVVLAADADRDDDDDDDDGEDKREDKTDASPWRFSIP